MLLIGRSSFRREPGPGWQGILLRLRETPFSKAHFFSAPLLKGRRPLMGPEEILHLDLEVEVLLEEESR
jgi:hypothetical protein